MNIDSSSGVHIERLPSGPLSTNTYLLVSSDDVVAVDPAPESSQKIFFFLKQTKKHLKAIWLTHSHWDHIAGCASILAAFPVPVMVHQLDAENLIDPGSDGIPSWVPLQPIVDLTFVTDGDELPLGSGIWTVLHSPGHSMGSVCFYNAKEGLLISGDTLFKGTMGNISFPTSAPDLMADTLVRLSSLPAATKIFPGHGSASTIGDERSWMVSAAQKLRNLS